MLTLFNPHRFLSVSKKCLPLLTLLSILLLLLGLYQALIKSPIDYQQGEMVRIMYIHVPCAWMSLGVYSFMFVCSLLNLIWNIRLCYIFAVAASLPGAVFSLITLITGSLWGKPIWGTWWVWDARLTSMLVLFLLYISYIIVVNSGDNILRAEKPASVIALIGFIDVPIVKFSVNIWYSLHQPASIIRLAKPAIDNSMLIPLLLMFSWLITYFLIITILRVHIILKTNNNQSQTNLLKMKFTSK